MPRFVVTLADPRDNTIHSEIHSAEIAFAAVFQHSWVEPVYRASWLLENMAEEDIETLCNQVYNLLGYLTCIVNLDEAIMQDLNAGASPA